MTETDRPDLDIKPYLQIVPGLKEIRLLDLLREGFYEEGRIQQVRAGYDRRAEQAERLPSVFRESFLARLEEPHRSALRVLGELFWSLTAEPSLEPGKNRPGALIRSEAQALVAELRYVESLCPRFGDWSRDKRCNRVEAELAGIVDALGLLFAGAADMLERQAGARPKRRP